MRVRKLQLRDAKYMLEWMHDESVVRYLSANFSTKTIEDCEKFIQDSEKVDTDLNLAIVDEDDIYMGTVSLKHIDKASQMAEFAITIRKSAMGKGFSAYGMREILRLGFEELGLKQIIWCVSNDNERAKRFYDKNGFSRLSEVPQRYQTYYSKTQVETLVWYGVQREENRKGQEDEV